MQKRIRLGAAAATLAATIAVSAGMASASTNTIYVNGGTGTDSGSCGSTAGSACATIQQGVDNAQAGDTVQVAAGTYAEQVSISEAVTIQGAGEGQTVIDALSGGKMTTVSGDDANGGDDTPIVFVNDSPVTIENLTVDGSNADQISTGCADDIDGIAAQNSDLTLTDVEVDHIRLAPLSAGLEGCQDGQAINAFTDGSGTTGSLTMSNDSVSDFAKTGVRVNGTGQSASISDSSVTATPDEYTATNGIQISRGATGTVTGNVVSGNECDLQGICGASLADSDNASAGVIIYDAGAVTIADNTVTGNDAGYENYDDATPVVATTLTGNTIKNNRYFGLLDESSTTDGSGNTIEGSNTGIENVSFAGDLANAVTTLTDSAVDNNQTGLEIDSEAGATMTPQTAVNDSSFTGNSTAIQNNTTQSADARYDLIFCASGSGCTTGKVTTASPTLKLSGNPGSIDTGGQVGIVTAELTGLNGAVIGAPAIPDGTSANITSSLGSVSAATTTDGVATAVLTSGSKAGTSALSASIDAITGTGNVKLVGPATVTKEVEVGAIVVSSGTVTNAKLGTVAFAISNPTKSSEKVAVKLSAKLSGHEQVVGHGTVTVRAGRQTVADLKLSAGALKVLHTHRKLSATEQVTTAAGSGSLAITLRG